MANGESNNMKAYNAGKKAKKDGWDLNSCPYKKCAQEAYWKSGFNGKAFKDSKIVDEAIQENSMLIRLQQLSGLSEMTQIAEEDAIEMMTTSGQFSESGNSNQSYDDWNKEMQRSFKADKLLKDFEKNKKDKTESQQMREWANSIYKQYEDRGDVQEQPDGETVDLSLRRYLNANPQPVQVKEDIEDGDMLREYKEFKKDKK